MNMQRSATLSLAGAIALALSATATVAGAQAPVAPSSTGTPATQQFYPGTRTTASYPLKDGTLTVNAGMPDHVTNYGPPPAFKTLDTNHDGRISESEAEAYIPLDSDFLNASHGGKFVTRSQYEQWTKQAH